MASTWSICRGNRLPVFLQDRRHQRKWMEQFEMAMYVRTISVSEITQYFRFWLPCNLLIIKPHRSNIKPERATANQHNFQCTRLKRTPTAEPVKCCWGEGSHTNATSHRNYRGSAMDWDWLQPMLLGYCSDLYYMNCFTDWLYWLEIIVCWPNLPLCSTGQCVQWLLIITALDFKSVCKTGLGLIWMLNVSI